MFTLRIMTFNIHGTYAWKQRTQINVETIQRANPDLIGFQEVEEENLVIYQQQLLKYECHLSPPIGDQEPYGYNAIFWKPSRLICLNASGFWLSETPDVASTDWGMAGMRTAQWIQFQIVDTKRDLLHINTHLDHLIERARIEGTKLILQWLEQFREGEIPIIVTGDFNCNPDTAVYRFLQKQGFLDTYRVTNHVDREYVQTNKGDSEYSNTIHAYGWTKASSSGAKREGAMRFDWIFFRDKTGMLKPTSCEIIHDAMPPLYPSDHYPVLAEFEEAE